MQTRAVRVVVSARENRARSVGRKTYSPAMPKYRKLA